MSLLNELYPQAARIAELLKVRGEKIAVGLIPRASPGIDTPEAGDPDYVAFNDITKDWAKAKTLEALDKTEAEMQTLLDDQMTALASPPMRQAVPAGW